jgi:RNA polymerase sigma-70 factor (ECF subfamily)
MPRQRRAGTDLSAQEFEAVVEQLERPLGLFVAQMIRSRGLAEDVLQETFLVAWRERARMPAPAEERRAWLYGVARNKALHALRKGRRADGSLRSTDPFEDASVGRQEPNEATVMRDLLERELSPSDRSLFVLRYVHGFSAQDLADVSGLRPATVRKRLERASTRLRTALQTQTGRGTSSEQERHHEPTIASA